MMGIDRNGTREPVPNRPIRRNRMPLLISSSYRCPDIDQVSDTPGLDPNARLTQSVSKVFTGQIRYTGGQSEQATRHKGLKTNPGSKNARRL